MRDINRIEPFLKQLEILWKQNPDMRFYQLIYAITQGKNMFTTEDDKMLEIIKVKNQKTLVIKQNKVDLIQN